tara:strand:+ start:788 stop:1252 length:465 start_codon:yes stop_codon:yes gene_type:complete
MTPEEKAAVMQLMGQTYGQMHKQDQMIVGESNNLTHQSNNMRQVFEQTAQLPTTQNNQQPPQVVPNPPALEVQQSAEPVATVTPEQAAQEIAAQRTIRTEQPSAVNEVDPNQMEFNLTEPSKIDELLDLVKKQNLILEKISLLLDNGKSAKNKK